MVDETEMTGLEKAVWGAAYVAVRNGGGGGVNPDPVGNALDAADHALAELSDALRGRHRLRTGDAWVPSVRGQVTRVDRETGELVIQLDNPPENVGFEVGPIELPAGFLVHAQLVDP